MIRYGLEKLGTEVGLDGKGSGETRHRGWGWYGKGWRNGDG